MKQPKDTRPTLIYVLKDPRTDEVRYVGKTSQKLDRRLGQHLRDKKNNHRCHWIQYLVRDGLKPILDVIETVPAGEDWVEREMYWIAHYKEIGARLVNQTKGGEGATGRLITQETREKMRQKQLGVKKASSAIEKQRKSIMIPVSQYTLDGEFIREWESATTAGRELGIDQSSITACAKGNNRRRKTIGGFMWRYSQLRV